MIGFSPFIGRKFVLKPVSVWLCFSETTKVEFADRGPRFAVRKRVDRLIDRYIIQTYTAVGRQTDRQTGRQVDRLTYRRIEMQTCTQADKQIERQTGRRTQIC